MSKWLLALALVLTASQADAGSTFWSPNVTGGGGANCNNGTYLWDADSGTAGAAHKCWATLTGGTVAAAVPGINDIATFDASSGGGTVVVNAPNNPTGPAQVNTAGITVGAFTGTLNFNTNNNNVTIASNGSFSNSGTGTRTVNAGSGTFTFAPTTGSVVVWNWGTLTNCTCTASAATITITPGAGAAPGTSFLGAAGTYGTLNIAGKQGVSVSANGGTIGTINLTAPTTVSFQTGTTTTITNNFNWIGTPANPIMIYGSSGTTAGTVASGAGSGTSLCSYCIVRAITFSGAGVTFTGSNSLDMGQNTGMTFSGGIGGVGIIGG